MAHILKRLGQLFSVTDILNGRSPLLLWGGGGLLVFFVLIGSGFLFLQTRPSLSGPPLASGHDKLFEVKAQTLVSSLSVQGTLSAGNSVVIFAPFDGVVREKKAQLGQVVQEGDVILVLDQEEIKTQYREAQAAFLQASLDKDALDHWDSSADVMRAKWALESAESLLAVNKRDLKETRRLFDRGIVARNEADAAVQTVEAQTLAVEQARQDYKVILEKGNPENREIADLKYQNAQASLFMISDSMEAGTVRSPANGVLVRVASGGASTPEKKVEPGSRFVRGDPVFAVADMETLRFVGLIDEMDIKHVHVGQVARIESDALPGVEVTGKIVSVSAEASALSSEKIPSFEVQALFPNTTDTTKNKFRLGMSARIMIETVNRADAIVIPFGAVHAVKTNPTVWIRDPKTGNNMERSVKLGAMTPAGVEVLSGISAGEEIVLFAAQ